MEGLKGFCSIVAITVAMLVISVHAQTVNSPCTASQAASATPCLNFITGSSSGGSSTPTGGCCSAISSVMSTSMDCACLIVTGNVPLPSPVNQALAITFSRACNLPLQCKASGVPLAAPGPALLAPPPPPVVHVPSSSPLSPVVHAPASSPVLSPVAAIAAPAPSHVSPTASKSSIAAAGTPAETPGEEPAETPASSPPVHSVAPKANPGKKPVVTSTISASSPSYMPSPFVLLVFMAIMVLKGY